MKKINHKDINDQQLIDVRTQHDYQAGHIKNSLNLNPGNFEKYATYYLDLNQPVIFIVGSEEEGHLEELSESADELGFTQNNGYLLIDEVPKENLQTTETIPAEEFLNQSDDFILLDVRHPDEITRPAPENNLVNIPFEDLVNDYQSLDTSKQIVTLCGSGNRSTAAASFLGSKGLNPKVIEGGMKAIQEVGK
ncbi:rhodanese-like domain-containing protein [Alkalibacterium sp. MB6]|uniref:rhodanese-like domain-containing protein n=1 Tax=Alkalibacterium sp. MB6 TaxID=2081965 RepID=UPI00137AA593|nr:rhodanese-like domain-containing protein [Alkalibacterium sp. MB6]